MKWVPDKTGRFAQRPHYSPNELEAECEKVVSTFLRKRYGQVSFPISTDDLTLLIEEKADFDSFADLSGEGSDVEGVTEFRLGKRPNVRIASALGEAHSRENRLRTTLTHEYGHVHFHQFMFEDQLRAPQLFPDPTQSSTNRCHRHTIDTAPVSDWLEWQAGYACGAFLMPLTALEKEVRAFCTGRGCSFSGVGSLTEDGTALIDRVRHAFQVSGDAARVRLIKRGVLVDGRASGTRDLLT